MINSSFYDEILKDDDAYTTEKLASSQIGGGRDLLEEFSTDELESLAATLSLATEKVAADGTVENNMTEANSVEKDKNLEKRDNANDAKVANPNAVTQVNESAEQAKTDAEREDMVSPEAQDLEDDSVVTAADCDPYELEKIAYEAAEEKLAYVTGLNHLKVADDIINNIGCIADSLYE